MNRQTYGDITKTRFINGKRYRFDATPGEMAQLEAARAATIQQEIDPVELAAMLDGIPADRVEVATRNLKEAHRRAEVARVAAAVAEVERLESGLAYLRKYGQIIADGGPTWHTTRRG